MTPDEKHEYLEALQKSEGAGLCGLELQTFRKSKTAVDAAQRARTELERALGTVRQLERVLQHCEGQAQVCADLLLGAEEQRRAQRSAKPSAADMAEQMAAEQMAHALGDQPIESNA